MTEECLTKSKTLVCLDCGYVFKGTPEEIAGRGWEQYFDSEGDFSICCGCRYTREIDGVKNDCRARSSGIKEYEGDN